MIKVREVRGLPVLSFIVQDADGVEYIVNYDEFNEERDRAVQAGVSPNPNKAEDDILANLEPDDSLIVRRADADD